MWGWLDCTKDTCFEILFYIVAVLAFLILVTKQPTIKPHSLYIIYICDYFKKVIFIILIFILVKKCLKKKNSFDIEQPSVDESSAKQSGNDNEGLDATSHSECSDYSLSDEEDDDQESYESVVETTKKKKTKIPQKEWDMHKKRAKMFQEQETQRQDTHKMRKKSSTRRVFHYTFSLLIFS